MGRSAKKSATKVGAAAVAVSAPPEPVKTNKREAEDELQKEPLTVSSKKRRVKEKKSKAAKVEKVEDKEVETLSNAQEDAHTNDTMEETLSNAQEDAHTNDTVEENLSNAQEDAPTNDTVVENLSDAQEDAPTNDTMEENLANAQEDAPTNDTMEEDLSNTQEDAPTNGTMDIDNEKLSSDPPIDISVEDDSAAKEVSAAAKEETENVTEEKSEVSPEEEGKEESPEADGEPLKSEKKNELDVEIADAGDAKENDKAPEEAPENPEAPNGQSEGQRSLFVGNLSFSIQRSDVENFFKVAGEVTDIRFGLHPDSTFRGFGHVEFATAEQAEKALLELNDTKLLGRRVRLDLAREKGAPAHSEGNEEKRSGPQGKTAFIRGFDKNSTEDQIRSLLEKNFGSCGEISRISIPKKDEEGFKGIAYIEFKDSDALNKALESNGFDFGEGPLSVEEAKPKRGGGPGGGHRGGGRFGGGGHRGRSRFSGGGGHGGGGGFRGRGGRRGRF